MNRLTISSIVTATILLVGCGGGSSSTPTSNTSNNNETNTKIGKGYYVDSAVKGVNYQCGKESGTTDENGTFTFENGSDCKFTLGGLKLREINASSLENNVTILETNETVAQLLQTLDSDGNASNGIQIPKGANSIVRDTLTSLDGLDQDLLEALHNGLKSQYSNEYNGTVIDRNQTMEHLNRTRADLEERGIRTNSDVAEEHRRNRDNNSTIRNTIENQRGDTNSTLEERRENRVNRDSNNSQERDYRDRGDSNNTFENLMGNRDSNNSQEQDYRGRRDSNTTLENLMENRDANSTQRQEHSGSASTRSENRQGRN